jgi:hypothetical protein
VLRRNQANAMNGGCANWWKSQTSAAMSTAARTEYDSKYMAARNYHMLVAIYEKASCNREERDADTRGPVRAPCRAGCALVLIEVTHATNE